MARRPPSDGAACTGGAVASSRLGAVSNRRDSTTWRPGVALPRPEGARAPRPDILDNPDSARVARVAGLARRHARDKYERFLVEGPRGVGEAVRHAAAHVHDLYLTPEAADRHADILARARAAGLYTHTVTPRVMAAMSTDAQGVLAVVATTALAAGPQPQEDGAGAGEGLAEQPDTESADSAEQPSARPADAEAAGAESAESVASFSAGAPACPGVSVVLGESAGGEISWYVSDPMKIVLFCSHPDHSALLLESPPPSVAKTSAVIKHDAKIAVSAAFAGCFLIVFSPLGRSSGFRCDTWRR